jgi:hypothetical protein
MTILVPVLSGLWGVAAMIESVREYRRSARFAARKWEAGVRSVAR